METPVASTRRPPGTTATAVLTVALLAVQSLASEVTLDDARELHRTGRLSEALEAYRGVAADSIDSDPLSAAIAYNNACVLLMNTGDHTAAVLECRAALDLARTLDDPRRLARTLNNLGLGLQYVGDFEEAKQRFREALTINEQRGDVESQVINWANLGVLATEAGTYSEALRCHDRAQQLAEEHRQNAWAENQCRVSRINRAVVLERIGAYHEALALYLEVLDEGADLDARQRANLQVNTGVVYRNLGDPVRAVAAFDSAAIEFEKLNDRAGLTNAILNQALALHLSLDQPERAEESYRRALGLTRQSGERPEQLRVLCSLGQLLFEQGRIVDAHSVFDECRVVSAEIDSSEGRWRAAEGLARIAAARGDPAGALSGLEQAIDEIEAVRESFDERDLRQSYFGEKRSIYAVAVDLLARQAESDPSGEMATRALEIAQRAKARSLLDALGLAGPKTVPLTAKAIADVIGDDLLLEYFFGEDRLYGWVVRNGGVRMFDAGPADTRRNEVAEMHAALERGAPVPPAVARALSNALLPDVVSLLEEADRTWVAPDGRLHLLPFELLVLPRSQDLLIRETEVSYLPSASALGLLRDDRPDAAIDIAGIGAPRPSTSNDRFPTPVDAFVRRFKLAELPGAAEELEMIRSTLPGEAALRVGAEATEENLALLMHAGVRVLHVATHTVISDGPGGESAIVLTPTETSDGLLHPAEIAALGRGPDLTVMSSCRSALGPHDGGDALAYLTGAFLAAGSSAVVATLWDVDDTASLVFMEQFYHQLGRGLPPAGALRAAKLTMIEDERWARSNNVWAAYVLVGRGQPVVDRSTSFVRVALVALASSALFALLLTFLVRSRRRRQSSVVRAGGPDRLQE